MSTSVLEPRTLEPEYCLLLWPDVLRLVPASRSTLQREIQAGRFPAPRRLGRRRAAWTQAEILAWIRANGVAEVA